MNKLFTSALLTVVAIPFLSAAPNKAAGKAQNSTAPATTTSTSKPATKSQKHVVKGKKANVKKNSNTAPAPAATPSK